jgi:hypothetical protein
MNHRLSKIYLIVEVYCERDEKPVGFRETKEEANKAVDELNSSKRDRYRTYEVQELERDGRP